jgi:hypothetical protein
MSSSIAELTAAYSPTDAEAGDHPENREAPEIPGERTHQYPRQIDDEGDIKNETSAITIRDPSEDQRSHYRTYDVKGRHRSEIGAG